MALTSVRNEGGGRGLTPITAQDPGILLFKGTKGGPLKAPPPKYKNVFYKLFLKLLNITRNKTCYTNKWVITKTVNCPGGIMSQKYYDDRSCARSLLSPAKSFG